MNSFVAIHLVVQHDTRSVPLITQDGGGSAGFTLALFPLVLILGFCLWTNSSKKSRF